MSNKKNKKGIDKKVSMLLPQNKIEGKLNRTQKNSVYEAFKKRVEKKALHKYHDKGENPVLLRLHFDGSIFDSTTEFLVTYDSFSLLFGDKDKEIGFTAIVRTIIVDSPFKLTVYKKQFKANLKEMRGNIKIPCLQGLFFLIFGHFLFKKYNESMYLN